MAIPDETVPIGDHNRWTVLAVTMVGIAATSFPVTVFGASLPEIADDLDTDTATIAWVMAAPLLAMAVFTPITGKLGDIHGHRRAYLAGFAVATALTALAALSWNVGSLIALRTLGQASGAVTGPAAMAIIMNVFQGGDRARALGYWSAVTALSPTLGVVVGGPMIDAFGWRILFLLQAAFAAVALLVAVRTLPETPRKSGVSFDFLGATTLGLGVGSLLFGLNRAPALGWDDPVVVCSLILAPLLLGCFVWVERRAESPLLPIRWLTNRGFAAPMVTILLVNAAFMGGFVLTPFLLERIFGYGTTTRALVMIVRPLMFAAGSLVGGRQAARLGGRRVVVLGMTSVAVGAVVIGLAAPLEALVFVVVGLAASGLGQGFARPALVASVGDAVPNEDLGVASGSLNTMAMIGTSIGITMFTAALGDARSGEAFFWIYFATAGVALLALAAGSLLPGPKARRLRDASGTASRL